MTHTEELIERYRMLGEEFAVAKSEREYIDEYKKSLLALLMKDAEKRGHSSGVAQEREARSSEKYLEIIEGLRAAVLREEKYRYHIKAIEIEIDVWRTREASARAEMRMHGA